MKIQYVHTTQPAILKRDIAWDDYNIDMDGYFTIAGLCLKGSRFYSETIRDIKDALYIFDKYVGTIRYFGGGIVHLYYMTNDGCDIILTKKVD